MKAYNCIRKVFYNINTSCEVLFSPSNPTHIHTHPPFSSGGDLNSLRGSRVRKLSDKQEVTKNATRKIGSGKRKKKKVLGYVFKDQVRFSSWYGVLPAWLDPLN